MCRGSLDLARKKPWRCPHGATWRLHIPTKGILEALTLVAAPDAAAPLAPGQVRVAIHAAGLNFRDVLDALGLYPGGAGLLGGEGAGVVIEVGADVTHVAPGDRVMGIFPGAFGPVAVTDHRLVTRMPAGWSFIQGAGIPVVFLTAYFGLVDLGHLKPGERLLIHAATGGVGMAAVQLARHLGAEIFGTASPGKWGTLRALGLDDAHIASSRTLDFEEHFLRSTERRGMDVVLDCLAREFVDASLRLLPRGGRFVEMGKTDIRSPEAVAAVHPGVAYRAYDVLEAGPDRIQQMFTELVSLFERGVLHPCPSPHGTSAVLRRRSASSARHATSARWSSPCRAPSTPKARCSSPAALARSAPGSPGTSSNSTASGTSFSPRDRARCSGSRHLQSELHAAGAQVTLAACDTADRDALQQLLASIPPAHPLTGVIHTAGVLDDGVLGSLTPERIDRVLRPKVNAALHLHELTRELDLSVFVLFSSIAGALGSPGQSNYAAANTFLDALCASSQGTRLPATSLAWGFWAERSGMTAHLGDSDLARLARVGMGALSPEDGLALFDAALSRPDASLVPARFHIAGLSAQADALPPLLRGFVRVTAQRPVAASSSAGAPSLLKQRLAPLSDEGKDSALLDFVRTEVATVLGHASLNAIEPNRPLQEIGLDSLMAVELKTASVPPRGCACPPRCSSIIPPPLPSSGGCGRSFSAMGPRSLPRPRFCRQRRP
jgi:NADPH:quinone reductase-like Zn-dependent oxidoreductase